MNKWEQIFTDMASHKIPYKRYYNQSGGGGGDLTYVTPTEQNRLQAEANLKRKIVDETKNTAVHLPKKKRKKMLSQIKKKIKTVPKKKKVTKVKKNKQNKQVKKKRKY